MSSDLDEWCVNTLHTRLVPTWEMWPRGQPKHTGVIVTKDKAWGCSAHISGRCRHVRIVRQHLDEMGVEQP